MLQNLANFGILNKKYMFCWEGIVKFISLLQYIDSPGKVK